MKLTTAQHDWLRHARLRGYDKPFTCMPLQSLVALEKLGLIERNPGSRGIGTEWRVTTKGLDLKLDG